MSGIGGLGGPQPPYQPHESSDTVSNEAWEVYLKLDTMRGDTKTVLHDIEYGTYTSSMGVKWQGEMHAGLSAIQQIFSQYPSLASKFQSQFNAIASLASKNPDSGKNLGKLAGEIGKLMHDIDPSAPS